MPQDLLDPFKIRLIDIATGLGFPEGPVALPDGTFVVVEMARGCVTHLDAGGGLIRMIPLSGGPNGAALGPDGWVYICNNGGQNWRQDGARLIPTGQATAYDGGRIERVHLATGAAEVLVTEGPNGPLRGPNDLVFDRQGGLWFTDMGKTRAREMDRGGVFYLPPGARTVREAIFPMMQPNGIGLSADERTLYVVETITSRLWAFDLPAPGEIASAGGPAPHGGRLIATLPDYRLPDSLAVDGAGNVCIATLMRPGISVVAPATGAVRHLDMPDGFTTNICFGGRDLGTAYVTLSSTGRLVAFDWAEAGLPLNFLNR